VTAGDEDDRFGDAKERDSEGEGAEDGQAELADRAMQLTTGLADQPRDAGGRDLVRTEGLAFEGEQRAGNRRPAGSPHRGIVRAQLRPPYRAAMPASDHGHRETQIPDEAGQSQP